MTKAILNANHIEEIFTKMIEASGEEDLPSKELIEALAVVADRTVNEIKERYSEIYKRVTRIDDDPFELPVINNG